MEYIKGVTFAPFACKGTFKREKTYESLKVLKERTGANFIILVPNGLQDTPQSEEIDFQGMAALDDEELEEMIAYAKSLGLRVALKPTVNCKNGTWRAHINFFDIDVICEPKWSNWFKAYTEFQIHYAKLAQRCGCEMFIAGCEMVQAERREAEWRKLIADIREVYHGLVSYNTDKYQEDHVLWWDCVDVISSSGYYPIKQWEEQLDRIEKVVKKFHKPFFFAEAGCMSVAGSNQVPNDWSIKGEWDEQGQADWYEDMFLACQKRSWVGGFAIWDWPDTLYPLDTVTKQSNYAIYGKKAEKIVKKYYTK